MKRNHQLTAVLREVERAGYRPQVHKGGRHLKITWSGADGKTRTIVISKTPGGGRGVANARACVRRLLREDYASRPSQ